MNNDDDLRQLFADATSEIRPHGTLDDIRTRTKKVDPMARRWFLPSLAAAAATALVIGGAFWMTRGTDDTSSTNIATSPSDTPTKDLNALPEVALDVPVYFVGDIARGQRLFLDTVRVTTCDAPDCRLLAAVSAAVNGGSTDPDYTSPWPKDRAGASMVVNSDGDQILIDFEAGPNGEDLLTRKPSAMSVAAAELAIQQLVYTAQAAHGEKLPVRFQFDHADTPTLLGVATAEPLAAGSADDLLAPVQITNVVDGATVPAGKLTVKGMAAAFEANVSWEILVGGDAVIDSGFATAAECCTLSPYEFTTNIPLEGPGTYTLVVHDNDESGEGRPVNRDSKEIVVE
ncbi:MAG: GerMN domain-containing protein [Propionibacteriales bacterium]|nr:GerMN domain-containing protein [Propionibacteriales bacterium]